MRHKLADVIAKTTLEEKRALEERLKRAEPLAKAIQREKDLLVEELAMVHSTHVQVCSERPVRPIGCDRLRLCDFSSAGSGPHLDSHLASHPPLHTYSPRLTPHLTSQEMELLVKKIHKLEAALDECKRPWYYQR